MYTYMYVIPIIHVYTRILRRSYLHTDSAIGTYDEKILREEPNVTTRVSDSPLKYRVCYFDSVCSRLVASKQTQPNRTANAS